MHVCIFFSQPSLPEDENFSFSYKVSEDIYMYTCTMCNINYSSQSAVLRAHQCPSNIDGFCLIDRFG